MKALPDLSLPTRVEAFDGGLKTGFSWRSKDCGDSQAQTQADHAPQGVAKLMGSLETSVVIELSIGWQPQGFPVLDHGLDRRTGKDGTIWPRSNQTSVQRYGVEHFDVGSTFDDQTFDDVETIQLTVSLCDVRQIPASWRRWMTSSTLAIQSSSPFQDATNGAYGGDLNLSSGEQFSLDGLSSVFSQGTFVLEFCAHPNNQVLNASLGALDVMRPMRAILPIDSVQPFPLSSLSPVMHRRNADTKPTSHGSKRFTLAHCAYHRFTSFTGRTFLTMVDSPSFMFPSTITNLFDISWHLGVRHQVAVTELGVRRPRPQSPQTYLAHSFSKVSAQALRRADGALRLARADL